jgi:hypothetical protein
MRWTGHVARLGKTRKEYGILVGNSEEKLPARRPRRREEVIIKMDLKNRI